VPQLDEGVNRVEDPKLPSFNYYLDESDPDILILRRQGATFAAAFSAAGASREGIVEAAKEDYRGWIQAQTGSLVDQASGEQEGSA